ncbi:hypothetical protein DU002_07915 [Corallincola holothuriorum]|uniref:Solute-binding protein family 3/N-terminal domain-containing protein n=2 Tax=Corallincola holothuriorum TaxID=2282215 RepID=A0A368NL35_9GAMM|nr:hypothetical protein DU002_07915 [Corallincola holothuriorum]
MCHVKLYANKILTLMLLCLPLSAFANDIVYPRAESTFDERVNYPLRLLTLALQKSGSSLQLKPSELPMQQGRALKQLARNDELDVVWSMTSVEREASLLPIRIPIYKGLVGWRLLLIREQKQQLFFHLTDSTVLKEVILGQGHDWPDTQILADNGFRIVPSSTYEGLFEQLLRERIEAFPRSVAEIWAEQQTYSAQGLVIEQRFALHYPTAFYYFVNPHRTDLADIITRGLEAAIADGSFDKLFNQEHGDILRAADLKRRDILTLTNTILPKATPVNRSELWYAPQ